MSFLRRVFRKSIFLFLLDKVRVLGRWLWILLPVIFQILLLFEGLYWLFQVILNLRSNLSQSFPLMIFLLLRNFIKLLIIYPLSFFLMSGFFACVASFSFPVFIMFLKVGFVKLFLILLNPCM
jgi:hypothetical protein